MRNLALAGVVAGVLAALTASAGPVGRGQEFPNFVDKDMNSGKEINLKKLRGKVVLIDFWATWCGPCKAELPNVKKAYEKYKKDGLVIISISLDSNVDTCKTFVKSEGMDWYHICDGQGWNAKLAKKYDVHGIPQMYILGRDGKVVSNEARGPELEVAIEQALKTRGGAEEDDDIDKAAKKELAAADALREKGEYAAALAKYDEIGVKYAGRDTATSANERAREMREDPEIQKKIKESSGKPKKNEEAAKQGEQWLKVARQMAAKKDYASARKYYQRVIDSYPGTEQANAAKTELDQLPK